MCRFLVGLAVALILGHGVASAGPIILGGDDLTDHGSRSGGVNQAGWAYIQNAINGMNPQVTRPGPFTADIIAIGSANPGVGVFTAGNAGGAINSVGNILGLSVMYVDGAAAINALFTNIGNGSVNGRILWISGTGAANDLDGAEIAALNTHGADINAFVSSGGGLMSHGSGDYGWLAALLPGLIENIGGSGSGHTLTAAGMAAFPGLTNANISSGPSHSWFSGNFGGLQVLALDGNGDPFILGGGGGSQILAVPEPATMALFGSFAVIGLVGYRRNRAKA